MEILFYLALCALALAVAELIARLIDTWSL